MFKIINYALKFARPLALGVLDHPKRSLAPWIHVPFRAGRPRIGGPLPPTVDGFPDCELIVSAPWRSSGWFFRFLEPLERHQKNVIFWHRSKTAKMREYVDPSRHQNGFWSKKRHFWGSFLHWFLNLFPNGPNPWIWRQLHSFDVFSMSQTSHFQV